MEGGPRAYLWILFLICCSAFFSGTEIAYASANKLRLKRAAEAGGWFNRLTHAIAERYDRLLCAVLMGNNLVNIAASSSATVIAISIAGDAGAAYASAVMTVVILIFGEIVPKQLAKEHAEGFARAVSPLVRALMILTGPLVRLVMAVVEGVSKLWGGRRDSAGLTEEELVTMIEAVEDEGVIDEERSDLLQSAIEFSEIEAQEIITHRVDMLALDVDDSLEEILAEVLECRYSRLPVYQNSVDNIIGVLYVNHLYKRLLDTKEFNLRALLTEVCYVHRTLTLPVVLEEMQRRKLHMAVVIDEFGGTLGILTMEDILEQLVGDIWDETDEIIDEFVEIDENRFEVTGNLGIYDFLEHLDMDDREFDDNFVTMGGWSIEMLGGFPKPGDSFTYRNLTLTVTEMDDLRVVKLQVRVNAAEAGAADRALGGLFRFD